MDTGELPADGLDEQRRHHRGIHPAGEGQQHLLIPHLAADELHLVSDEVFHIPVGLRLTRLKNKAGKSGLSLLRFSGPGMLSLYPRQQHRDGAVVNVIPGVDLHAVHHAVGAAFEDDAPDVGEGLQLFRGDVVGVDFAVYPQGPDFPGQAGIFLAAKVEDEYHILFHCGCRLLQKNLFLFYYIGRPGATGRRKN